MYVCCITFVFFFSCLFSLLGTVFSLVLQQLMVCKIIRCEVIGDVYRLSEMQNDCLEVGGRPDFKLLLKTVLYLNNLRIVYF